MIKFIKSLRRNMLFVLQIEIVSLFLYTYVIFPFCQWLIERVMRSQGYGYFFDSNISGSLQNKWIVLTLIGIVLFLGILFYFEIMILMNALINTDLTILKILKKTIRSIKKLFSFSGIILIFISFFISIVIHFNLLTRIVQSLGLIEFIRVKVLNNPIITVITVIIVIALLFLVLRFIFVYPILASGNTSVKRSFFLSAKLMKGNYHKAFFRLLLVNVLGLVFLALVYLFIMFVVILFIKSSVIISLQYATSMTVMDTVNRLLVFFYSTAVVIINLEFAVLLCKRYSLHEPYIFSEVNLNLFNKKSRSKRMGVWMLIVLSFLVVHILINDDFLHNFRLRTGYSPEGRRTEIFAHRGNSYTAPENTRAALKSAIEERSDGVEIDVRMTKDGELILMHDSSLLRTTGVNEKVSQLDYNQLADLDVGSWFSPAFRGEKIPTLRDALELCKGELTLMIEIKSDIHEEETIARRVVEAVEDIGMDQDVIIASFDLNVLKEVKGHNTTIATCLILRFAYGHIDEMEYVDMFSMESRFLQKGVVQRIKNSGKALAAWTVNDSKRIAFLRDMGIDAVITDRPVRAREIFYEDAVPGFLSGIISSILKQ